MDIGVISVRYARALLKAATEDKTQQQVYDIMLTLAKAYIDVPQMRQVIENPMVPNETKWQVMMTAAANTDLELVKNLLHMVLVAGREKMLQYIANSYVTLYRQQYNIINGKITTASAVTPETADKLRKMIEAQTKGKVDLETAVDPDLIGGFILEYDTYRIDASVKKQLNSILKQLKVGS